jgi:GH15 family glucan-1,4-alpha-glucosidase
LLLTARSLVESSVALIEGHQHPSGAYPASPSYPVYRYSWLRDGSFIADAMSRAGRPDGADSFHRWCADVVGRRRDLIARLVERSRSGEPVPEADLLPTRYTLDGEDGTDHWWNFQLDGYGTWLWALATHTRRHGRLLDSYLGAVESTVDYLVEFGVRPCYDWWEEHVEQRHTSTLSAVAAGLNAAVAMTDSNGRPLLDSGRRGRAEASAGDLTRLLLDDAARAGHLTKWLGSDAVDGSLLASLTAFGTVDAGRPLAERTYAAICDRLVPGGVYRYLGDTFYGGGEWVILTAWLGWYEALTGRTDAARSRLSWIADRATPEGLLPEQVSDAAQRKDFIDEWIQRWGPVATPLLWSHAMFVTLAVETGLWSPPC